MVEDQEFPTVGFGTQLILKHILEHAANVQGRIEIVYKDLVRENYAQLYQRCQRLSNALEGLGVKQGSKVIAFEWNTHRFLEIYFSVPCMGGILHMGNPLLTPDQIVYIINRAEDEILFFNEEFTSLIESIRGRLKTIRHYVVLSDEEMLPETNLKPITEYEALLLSASPKYEYPELKEDTVASLSNTTGTTGDPKICFFTHRQHVLHTLIWANMLQGFTGERRFNARRDATIQLVPMFHAHGWGIPYIATFLGCRQILPGRFNPKDFLELLKKEKKLEDCAYIACVPTMIEMILFHPEIELYRRNLKGLIYEGGGIRLTNTLARKIKEFGIDICAGWGMTEVYTKVALQYLKPHMSTWADDKKLDFLTRTGMPVPFVEQRVIDKEDKDVPKDGKTEGEIVLRAPWLTQGYLKDPDMSKELWRGGWMHTDDLATIDEEESVLIMDRAKDVIKSGGEWISSLTLENLIHKHPKVQEVAVVAAKSEKWGERPVAVIVPKNEYKAQISGEEITKHLTKYVKEGKILNWWIPGRFIFADQIPRTSVGKFDKKTMRSIYWSVFENDE